MKIFPISEVWSQVVLSPLAKTGAADVIALTGAAIATVCGCGDGGVCACVGGALTALLQFAVDIIELIGGDHMGIGRSLHVG